MQGTILASTLITKAALLLQDVDNIKWSRAEMLDYLNEAQRQIAVVQPNANTAVTVMTLVAGSRQTLPPGGLMLVDAYRNMGKNGETPSRSCRVVSRKLIDAFDIYWHAVPPGPQVQNVVFDEQDQQHFWVYPANDGNGTLEISYTKMPTVVTEGEPINVSDAYEPAIIEYMLYRACSKEADFSPGPDRAVGHFSAFNAAMASKMAGEATNNPNLNRSPQMPSVPGGSS